ncbi:MAG: hypothetical protein QOE06_2728 [Thermoleophilaceae bacterium]|jgi:heme-degrading monooxygenase HmoA|nr:hypothetical protein [Thermoleophilaceae bacterium]
MYVTIAIHHAKAEHAEEFLGFMKRVQAAVLGADGLIEFSSWREPGGSRLVGYARWESEAAFHEALPTVLSLSGERREEWTERPDEILALEQA